jgi:hypothetical protein
MATKRIVESELKINEDGNIEGFVVVEVTSSFDAGHKAAAKEARENGKERPIGGEVPYRYRYSINNPIDEVVPMAVSTAVIRDQRHKSNFKTADEFEKAYFDKTIENPLYIEGRSGVDPYTRASRDITKLNKEQRAKLREELAELERLEKEAAKA